MELIMDFKEGSLIYDWRGNMYLVSFKTLYNLVLIEFNSEVRNDNPYSDWQNNLPLFTWKNYSLTNIDEIRELNGKFDGSLSLVMNSESLKKVYGVEIGSIVDFDYKPMMLVGQTDRKVLSFTLKRPVLFDFNKAKEKYIVFDRLNKLSDLQSEFNSTWSEYLITPFASKENINWTIIRDRLPFEQVIGKSLIEDTFKYAVTSDITLDEFYSVINTKKLNGIKDESIKKEIIELIKQTLILAKENQSIGSKSEPKNSVEPITVVDDKNAGKTLYKINVVVSAMDKDGGRKYPKIYDVYADNETEALGKIRKQFDNDEEFKLNDLYFDYAEVVEVISSTKKEPVLEKTIEETDSLDDLLALYKIEETENLDDLLKLYE